MTEIGPNYKAALSAAEIAVNQANRLVDEVERTSGSIWGEAMQLACQFWTHGEELRTLWFARKI